MNSATIIAVMESEPLGLRLRIAGQPDVRLFDLADACSIRQGRDARGPGDLRPGQRIRFLARGPLLLAIEILPT